MDFNFLMDTFGKLLAVVPTTLGLFALSMLLGAIISLIIVVMRVSPYTGLVQFAKAYVLVFRGSPLLIQMFLVYYGLGQFDAVRESAFWLVLQSPYMCAVLTMALCTAAYTAEIIRGGLLAVPRGHVEAGLAIGMSRFTLTRRVIAPVALRSCLPAYSTEAVLMVKSTALASLVTVLEVTGVAQQIIQRTYRTMEVFLCAAAIYLILNFVLLQAFGMLEKKLSPHKRKRPSAGRPISAACCPEPQI